MNSPESAQPMKWAHLLPIVVIPRREQVMVSELVPVSDWSRRTAFDVSRLGGVQRC
jgi:hypothetical protein